jgi:hypothetical protein
MGKTEFSHQLPKVADLVELLLSQPNSDRLRDSDKLLILAYMNRYHGLAQKIGDRSFAILREIIMNEMPSLESITRSRRKFQEEGKYIGTNKKERKAQEAKVRENLRKTG